MTRNDFIKRVVQAGLFAALTFLVFALKNRIVSAENCSSCPDTGNCPGRNACSRY